MDNNLNVKHRRLFTLAAQLKAGKGLTVGATIVEVNKDKDKDKDKKTKKKRQRQKQKQR